MDSTIGRARSYYCAAAFEVEPSSGTGLNLAYLLAAQGKYPEVIDAVDRAMRSDPASPLTLEDAGHTYEISRRYEESARLYRKALALAPTSHYAWDFLHNPLLLSGHSDEAFDAWLAEGNYGRGPLEIGDTFREVYRSGGWPAVWTTYLQHVPAAAHWTGPTTDFRLIPRTDPTASPTMSPAPGTNDQTCHS
jgi:hypothetical protein